VSKLAAYGDREPSLAAVGVEGWAMSRENVEIVREVMELFNDGGPRAIARLRDLIAEDVHVDMSRRVFNPDTYDGHEGLLRLSRETRAV
jgi:hypothetical protein